MGTGVLTGEVADPAGAISVSAESVEEFRIKTNNVTFDFGVSGCAQIFLTTKNGTDVFHGSGYEFFRAESSARTCRMCFEKQK